MYLQFWQYGWSGGHMVRHWLWDHEVPGSHPAKNIGKKILSKKFVPRFLLFTHVYEWVYVRENSAEYICCK